MKFTQLKTDLSAICEAFNLGELKGYKTKKNEPIQGYNTAYFETTKETNLKYHFKN